MSAGLPEARRVLDELSRLGVRAKRLCADSRLVQPGDVFVAYRGEHADGRRYLGEAQARGAAALLWDDGDPRVQQVPLRVPGLAVADLRALAGYLAHLVYGRPSQRLSVVGVTGTNGKTSVSQWIARGFEAAGRRCAVIGTLGSGFPDALADTANTTPEPITLQASLARFLADGASACAMEVSSVGLDQGRVNGVEFACAVFTNLTRDHLEYHGSFEAYGAAKARLFDAPGLRCAVLNLDDALGRELAARLRASGVRRIGYTLAGEAVREDMVEERFEARCVATGATGTRFTMAAHAGEAAIDTPLIGRFNVSNLLAVAAALYACGMPFAQAAGLLHTLASPAGRMQRIGGTDGPLAVVDYAHTPDALEQALLALREVAEARGGHLVCVFGCGGERDPGKRAQMGAVAARRADRVILTDDNPRSEDPRAILEQIRAGAGSDAIVIEDRAEAIRRALASAGTADVVLIAGKGHERYQEAGGVRRPFSDAGEVRSALARWRERAA